MTEDTFAKSPFGVIIEALHTLWTLVGTEWPWVAPARFKFAWGAMGFRRVLRYYRQMPALTFMILLIY